MELFPGNAQWIGQRHEQQDAFGFVGFEQAYFRSHAGVLAVVADGMGGLSNGREASQTALQSMLDAYRDKRPDESIPEALLRSLIQANAAVHTLALASDEVGNVGTTLVAAAVCGDQVFWVSAGDSRLYLYRRADDSLTSCTQDHNLGNELMAQVAAGEHTREQVDRHPDRDALTSFLGLPEIPKVDRNLRPLRLDEGDRLMLCSDGVYGVLSAAELKAALKQEAQAAAEDVIAAAQAKQLPRQDNATVAVLATGGGLAPAMQREPVTRRQIPIKPRRKRRWLLLGLWLLLLVLISLAAFLSLRFWLDPLREWIDPTDLEAANEIAPLQVTPTQAPPTLDEGLQNLPPEEPSGPDAPSQPEEVQETRDAGAMTEEAAPSSSPAFKQPQNKRMWQTFTSTTTKLTSRPVTLCQLLNLSTYKEADNIDLV